MGPGCCSTVPMRILAVLAKNCRPPLITLTFPMPPGVMGATRQKKPRRCVGLRGLPTRSVHAPPNQPEAGGVSIRTFVPSEHVGPPPNRIEAS